MDDQRLTESAERLPRAVDGPPAGAGRAGRGGARRVEAKTRAAEEARRREFDAAKRKMEDDERRAREAEETRVAKANENLKDLGARGERRATTSTTRRESWERRAERARAHGG